jgi:hypothetical protein
MQEIVVQFPAGKRAFSFFQKSRLALGPPNFLFDWYYRLFFLGVDQPGHQAGHSPNLLLKLKWV